MRGLALNGGACFFEGFADLPEIGHEWSVDHGNAKGSGFNGSLTAVVRGEAFPDEGEIGDLGEG